MWIYVLIVLILLVIIGMGALLYMRNIRKDEINSQQAKLEEVKSLPFQDDLVKVKDYNLHGEALTLYKKWQTDWQNALNSSLTEAENDLGSASEDIERFRFKDGREKLGSVNQTLDKVEQEYRSLTSEISQLLDSNDAGERNFHESERLFREAKRDVLANGHKFGDSQPSLEKLIETYEPELKEYEQLVNAGNYVTANKHIDEVHEELSILKENMDEIPLLIKDVQKELPQQFQEIRFGCRDLKAEGYDLEHIKVESKLSTLKGKLNLVEPLITRLELDEARAILDDINTQLDDMLELVEHEVKSKTTVDHEQHIITDDLFHAKDLNYTLRTEIDYIKEQFHINESDIHKVQKFEHEIENLIDVYDEITTEMRKTTARYSEVLDNLEYIKGNIGAINDEQKQIQQYLINLREDEAEARENALLVQDRKEDIYRELMSSNMSSVPEKFLVMKNELDIDVKEIHKYFERRPLNVQYIKDKVNHTVLLLNKFDQEAYEILQEARLTEMMIQYGNRYRRDDHDFNTMLTEAERLFKENRYKRALEIAKNGLEKVEPGAASRIEKEFDNE
ncbi:septation ring formation regulator EzrA [Salinicoccus halodurans]|uniref:Septation ring formation regulator EzrA n=1 Tax=Salinicoccus halodurans TaxID=407035 RepID=A0A0F7HMR3_9STAP|nr:septation ring formation regulator EzrA [Salinicoccus halodurans]AKG74263.1 septation ring formation regulator EzrA [Salinicoccus halodurans]SFK93692.1 septation ring formation regulator [Salinicoccus halodurans]